MRISDWSSDVCSSDLEAVLGRELPQATASAIATENRLSENGQLPVGKVPGLGPELSIFDTGFDASWEIDLWGGTRRAIESAEARADAAEEARRAVVMQVRSEEHTSELQSLMRISYAVFCLKQHTK